MSFVADRSSLRSVVSYPQSLLTDYGVVILQLQSVLVLNFLDPLRREPAGR